MHARIAIWRLNLCLAGDTFRAQNCVCILAQRNAGSTDSEGFARSISHHLDEQSHLVYVCDFDFSRYTRIQQCWVCIFRLKFDLLYFPWGRSDFCEIFGPLEWARIWNIYIYSVQWAQINIYQPLFLSCHIFFRENFKLFFRHSYARKRELRISTGDKVTEYVV